MPQRGHQLLLNFIEFYLFCWSDKKVIRLKWLKAYLHYTWMHSTEILFRGSQTFERSYLLFITMIIKIIVDFIIFHILTTFLATGQGNAES